MRKQRAKNQRWPFSSLSNVDDATPLGSKANAAVMHALKLSFFLSLLNRETNKASHQSLIPPTCASSWRAKIDAKKRNAKMSAEKNEQQNITNSEGDNNAIKKRPKLATGTLGKRLLTSLTRFLVPLAVIALIWYLFSKPKRKSRLGVNYEWRKTSTKTELI